MKNYIKFNRYFALVILLFTFIIYKLTIAPTVSMWDCGEFIACSYKLQVPHPPGAPFFLLVGRLFSMLPFVEDIALRVNYISVLSSAFTIMLLYLSIVRLVREWKGGLLSSRDWLTAIFSGALGSLTFAFTHSFWFNAVEAEVYAPSMLFTALLVWLILVWVEKSEEPGNERYLLMISYVIGLAIGIHLLNVLALPFVTLIYYYKRFEFNLKTFIINILVTIGLILFIYPGIVKYLPRVADVGGVMGLVLVFVVVIGTVIWSINNNRKLASLLSLSLLLLIIGYSSYTMIFIRSNLDPNIDENNPETIEKFISYLNREQYGDHSITDRAKVWRESPNGKNYKSAVEYFWRYQVDKMYIRYFSWQFVGMDENEESVSFNQFYALPLLLGLFGFFWHFKKDRKHALAVLALFFMTGLAIVLYLNQPDPQPRERDYSYVSSFFAFSIWIGLGYAGIMELIRGDKRKEKEQPDSVSRVVYVLVFLVLLVIIPVHMLAKNYDSHDRSGRYIAWDYSYNMLQSCEPNGIIFTNGDNDTFPLWYLQEVEGVRTDIRIVNLSLLNTGWYIKQLRDLEPRVPIRMSDGEIDRMGLMKWEKQTVRVPVPEEVGESFASDFRSSFSDLNIEVPDRITFEVKPTLNTRYGPALRVQDLMILKIIHENRWRKPIYFAVTVARSNMLSELQNYMRMDGLSLKLVPYKNWKISPTNLGKNLVKVYKYRGLQNPEVQYDNNIIGLLQNYRTAFLQVTEYHAQQNEMQKVEELLTAMEKKIPGSVIPWTNKYLRLIKDSYMFATKQMELDSVILSNYNEQELILIGESLYRMKMYENAGVIFENIFESNPNNIQVLSLLIGIYEKLKNYEKAINQLEFWLNRNPNDSNARAKLEEFKQKAKV